MSLTDDIAATPLAAAWRRRMRKLAGVALGLAVTIAAGLALAFAVARADRERELLTWQNRLSVVADSRFAEVSGWLERQFEELSGIAANTSVQLYMTELALSGTTAGQGAAGQAVQEPALASYLRNLLTVTAERSRFSAPLEGPDVPANVRRIGVAGLALLDRSRAVVTQTQGMPPLGGELAPFIDNLPVDSRAVFDIYRNAAGRPAMGFAVPVFSVQGGTDAASQVGWIVGVKEIGGEVYPLLKQPGEVFASGENMLVRRRDGRVEYLSPLADGTPPLTRSLSVSTANLAAAAAVLQPGQFAEGRDYANRTVLHVSRAFDTLPWVLVAKIDSQEALAGSEQRRRQLMIVLTLIVVFVAAAIAAAWWYGASRLSARAAERYKRLSDEHARQEVFLRLIADNQPTAIFILDREGRYGFANQEAATQAGLPADDFLGKPAANVIGPDAAKTHLAHAEAARATDQRQRVVLPDSADAAGRTRQVDYIPIGDAHGVSDGVLVVERDISAEVQERARRERALMDLVRTLVALVDKRDPYAAHHSTRVATVAQAVAREMGLDATAIQTVGFAGNLMNLGKILVPTELLTKRERLNEEELGMIRDSLRATADFLAGIDFGGPVVETLRQLSEHWDGSGGPNGLKGEAILPEARAVAVANAFVALASPRAYRAGISLEDAVAQLRKQADTVFDRRAVAALENALYSRGGREAWADFGRQA